MELDRRGFLGRPDTFLFTSNWRDSGQLGYATRNTGSPVLCYNAGDARGFAFWSHSVDWVHHDGVLVSMDDKLNEPGGFKAWFTSVEPVCDRMLTRGGLPARRFRIFRCRNQKFAFPFDRNYGNTPTQIASKFSETRHPH
jgi:hypothetical protein